MTWIAALIGVVVGYAITSYVHRRRFAAVFELLHSDIVNTSAPTTAELNYPYRCPRCSGNRMRGHASTQPAGLTCINCGWVRYADPYTHKLWDAMTQPPYLRSIVKSSTD